MFNNLQVEIIFPLQTEVTDGRQKIKKIIMKCLSGVGHHKPEKHIPQ